MPREEVPREEVPREPAGSDPPARGRARERREHRSRRPLSRRAHRSMRSIWTPAPPPPAARARRWVSAQRSPALSSCPRRARARPSPRRPARRSWDLREVPVEGEMRWCVERSAHRTWVSGTGHWCEGAIGDEESRQNVRADRSFPSARRDGSGASLASERRGPASIRSIQAVPRAIAPR